jgi:hypothetical protein
MDDNLSIVSGNFFNIRTKPLDQRFPGYYRAVVVETNDPLQIYRIRFKCPELHDFSLKPEECPWALAMPAFGSKMAGTWQHPCIGDIVWITFEKQHPYGPIWAGMAMGTRLKRYPLESIYTKSPRALANEMGKLGEKPDDFIKDYLSKDLRPMAHGWTDRYGHSEINSSIGFFPPEHDKKPATPGTDALANKEFLDEEGEKPKVNDPDMKYIGRLTKYGIYIVQSDVGYYWKKDKDGDFGEFKGIDDDLKEGGKEEREFEVDRYKYFTKLFNEDKPRSIKDNTAETDQRRYEIRTRAGHLFEMRDVGWAQKNGGLSVSTKIENVKSRIEDKKYGGRILSKWEKSDERWTKFRSKGGHLIQMMDAGFHPEKDNFYKRKLLDEVGAKTDGEEEAEWTKRDSRQIRYVTRYGIKLVLDDRGSHPAQAELKESPRANGWLLKSRRSWEEDPGGTPRGFAIECNDKDELNTTRWYTPKSKIIEMNDRKDYVIMCTDTKGEISREWMGKKENEFALKIAMTEKPEEDTYHMKLDKRNGYLRLKTAAGGDNGRRPKPEPEETQPDPEFPEAQKQSATGSEMVDAEEGINQGLECRDGRVGEDGPWAEVNDMDDRGIWFSRKFGLGVIRAKEGKDIYIAILDKDGEEKIIIRNGEDGPVQIYAGGDISLVSAKGNIKMHAVEGEISFKAKSNIKFESDKGQISVRATAATIDMYGGGGQWKLSGARTEQNVDDFAPTHPDASGSSQTIAADPVEPLEQEKRKPEDRAAVGNEPFDEIDEKVIKAT